MGICYKYEAENLVFCGPESAVDLLVQFLDGVYLGVQAEEKKNSKGKTERGELKDRSTKGRRGRERER